MREAGKPVSAGDVTKALGADRKEVDKAFAELKKEGAIVSPVLKPALGECGENGVMYYLKDAKADFFKMMELVETVTF